MIRSTQDLREKHGELLKLCAAQRDAAGWHAAELTLQVAGVDRGIERLRRWAAHPAVIVAGIALLVTLGRYRSLRSIVALLALVTPMLRFAGSAAVAGRRMHREKLDVR